MEHRSNTVKPVLFVCPLFGDLGDVVKITGREYSKSYHLLVVYIS